MSKRPKKQRAREDATRVVYLPEGETYFSDETLVSLREHGAVLTPPKRVNIKGEPVLFFDNKSNNSYPAIELLTISETARFLKISATGVRRLQYKRLVPFIKVGGSVRFTTSDIIAYLQKRRVEPIDQ